MIARMLMRHRTSTTRDQGGSDSHGADTGPDYQPHLAGVPCRVYYRSGSLQQQPSQTETIENLALLLPVGTDFNVDTDRLGDITDRRGNVLVAGPLEVEGPLVRRDDHLQLALRGVS